MSSNTPTNSQHKPNLLGASLDLLTVGGIYIITQVVVAILLIALGVNDLDKVSEKPGILLVAYIVAGLVTLTLTIATIHYRKINRKILQLKKIQAKDFGYALLGYGVYMLLTLFAMSLLGLIPGVDPNQEQDLGLNTVTISLLPLTFIALVIIPPFVEEVLFRGYLYGRLKYHRFSRVLAAVITSVTFGLVHGQINVGLDTFILSMVMIFMLERRKSLWVSILMHFFKNLVAFLAAFVFKIV